jgi:hypothetical protein
MIGIIAEEKERAVVEEFFELFKTPWEFASGDRTYDVLLVATDTDRPVDSPVVILYGSGGNRVDERNGIRLAEIPAEPLLRWRNGELPLYGKAAALEAPGDVILESSGVHQAIGVRIGKQDRVLYRFGFDLFREVAHLLGVGQPPCHAPIPTLDLHIRLLRECILSAGLTLVEVPPVPAGHAFVACLTHDVDFSGIRRHKLDHTMFGFLYRALFGSFLRVVKGDLSWSKLRKNWQAAVLLPFVWAGAAKDFMASFERYVEIEGVLPSTFFFIPFKNMPGRCPDGAAPQKRAVKYDITEIGPDVRRLASSGKEVALHGLDAWLDIEAGRAELNRVKETFSEASDGVRMHWLYFSGQSPAILERAGFTYDATSGYNEVVGYRAGTAQVFRPPGAERMLELPLHVMDTALFLSARMARTQAEACEIVGRMAADLAAHGGALTLNWHCRSLGPERFWDDSYSRLLAELKNRGAWFGSAHQVVRWFAKRRSVRFRLAHGSGNGLDIDLSCGPGDEGPALILRVHMPDGGARGNGNPKPQTVTRDIPMHGDLHWKVSTA